MSDGPAREARDTGRRRARTLPAAAPPRGENVRHARGPRAGRGAPARGAGRNRRAPRRYVVAVEDGAATRRRDSVAGEEPLEIRVLAGDEVTTLSVTMRTPGDDFELAAGFLRSEGVVASRDELASMRYCLDPDLDPEQRYNVLTVALARPGLPDLARLERHLFASSACGVCGRAGLENLERRGLRAAPPGPRVSADVLRELPAVLRGAQRLFERTGGLHAAALFDARSAGGELLCVREDIGRHNAVDKVLGWSLLEGPQDLAGTVLLVSGRAGFEIVHKAVAVGVPVLASVSAPSSLAVDTAERFGLALVGFLRGRRFNVYAGAERLALDGA